jgi:hypothetical protein
MVRALDIVKLGKEVMTSRVRASRDLQGTIDLQYNIGLHLDRMPIILLYV